MLALDPLVPQTALFEHAPGSGIPVVVAGADTIEIELVERVADQPPRAASVA